MESWALKIERQLADVRAVYAYVNNHFEGFALESAQRLAERLGTSSLCPPPKRKLRRKIASNSIFNCRVTVPVAGLLVGRRERLPYNLFQGAAVAHLYPYRICSAPK